MHDTSRWSRIPLALALLALASPASGQMVPGPSSPAAPGARPTAPRAEFSAWAGDQLNSDVDLGSAELQVDDAPSFGASISVPARPGTKIELLWIYSSARARLDGYGGYSDSRSFDVDMHYFQIGGVQGFRRGTVEPFAGMTLGAAWYLPGDIVSQTGSYDLGTGGSGLAVSGAIPFIQGDFSAGLVFAP
jgi:hypothetical protein